MVSTVTPFFGAFKHIIWLGDDSQVTGSSGETIFSHPRPHADQRTRTSSKAEPKFMWIENQQTKKPQMSQVNHLEWWWEQSLLLPSFGCENSVFCRQQHHKYTLTACHPHASVWAGPVNGYKKWYVIWKTSGSLGMKQC